MRRTPRLKETEPIDMSDGQQSILPRRISKTALRLMGLFALILTLFAVSLRMTLYFLQELVEMQSRLVEIDRAKHAGHLTAVYVREQYIHQAHTLINWNLSHLDHYEEAVELTRAQTAALQRLAPDPKQKAYVDKIIQTAAINDELFRHTVIPAIERDDRIQARALNDRLDTYVDEVVRLNDQLNGVLEARSKRLLDDARRLRRVIELVALCCFGLAIMAALILGISMTRSILGPLRALREGLAQVAEGDLSTRIDLDGRDEFGELAHRFNRMTVDLARHQAREIHAQKLASIGRIAAGLAHEINNPLEVILGYVKLMLKNPKKVKESYLRTIDDEIRQCQRIVQGLLELGRPLRLEVTRVDLAELAREALERLKDSGQTKDVQTETLVSAVPVVIKGDETKLRQVAYNLLLNAVEAMPGEGTVTIEVSQEGNQALLRITDTGPGISPTELPHLFEPFFSTKPTGSGLGLVTSQAIATAHGGTIDIRSEPGQGTSVTLRLPSTPPIVATSTRNAGSPPRADVGRKPKTDQPKEWYNE
jgi:two-component system, NtrC family, sensor kinase